MKQKSRQELLGEVKENEGLEELQIYMNPFGYGLEQYRFEKYGGSPVRYVGYEEEFEYS